MSEDQDAQNIDALVNAFNDASFEGMENPRGELNQLYRKQTSNSIDLTGDIRDGFDRAYRQNKNALRDSLVGVIRFSNDRLRRNTQRDPSQKENTDKRTADNRALIEGLNALW